MEQASKTGQPSKYFLYIDILGFSTLVTEGRIGDLYRRLDRLNAHKHPSFSTIVFSDTIVIYNKYDLDWDDEDKTALVSRLCEFAADLFYRLISQDIHFRGYICCGDFLHSKMEHIEAFYGRALVESYNRTKTVQCAGLFVENGLEPHIGIFQSDKYDEHCHYVHLLRGLREFGGEGPIDPTSWSSVESMGDEIFLAYDFTYLKNIYVHMSDMNLEPRVRVKYLSAWQMIQKQHRSVLDALEKHNFDPRAIGAIDWRPIYKTIGTKDGLFE
jgi:hypothetical protein